MDDREARAARKWIAWQLREGTAVADLHAMVDSVARNALAEALRGERKERQRADVAEVRCHELTTELDGLRAAVEAIPRTA